VPVISKGNNSILFCQCWRYNVCVRVCVQHAEAVRCFCNDAACVSTAYICKSQVGLCFSRSTPGVATAVVSHGCADSLPAHLLHACTKRLSDRHHHQQQQQPVVTCCADDLCNYVTSRTGSFKYQTTKTNLSSPLRHFLRFQRRRLKSWFTYESSQFICLWLSYSPQWWWWWLWLYNL